MTGHTADPDDGMPATGGWSLTGLVTLLLRALLFVFGRLSDLVADSSHGIPRGAPGRLLHRRLSARARVRRGAPAAWVPERRP